MRTKNSRDKKLKISLKVLAFLYVRRGIRRQASGHYVIYASMQPTHLLAGFISIQKAINQTKGHTSEQTNGTKVRQGRREVGRA